MKLSFQQSLDRVWENFKQLGICHGQTLKFGFSSG